MPGRTPTAVPSSTPITANIRFIGWTATTSPCASAANVSTATAFSDQAFKGTGGKAERQELGEHQVDQQAEPESDGEISRDLAAAHGGGGGGEQHGHGEDESAAHADDRDHGGEAGENEPDGEGIGFLPRGQV